MDKDRDIIKRQKDILKNMDKTISDMDKKYAKSYENSIDNFSNQMSDMMDNQIKQLQSFYASLDTIQKESIQNDMVSRQEAMENYLSEFKKNYSLYNRYMDSSTKALFKEMYKTTEQGISDIQAQMDKRFSRMSDSMISDIDDVSNHSKKSFSDLIDDLSDAFTQLNISNIASNLEDKLSENIDTYVQNQREMMAYTNGQFNTAGFNKAINASMNNSLAMNRNEASEFVSDFVKSTHIKDTNSIIPYMEDLANLNKLGVSSDTLTNSVFMDSYTASKYGNRGGLVRDISNIATSLSTNMDLNVDMQNVLSSIDEHIQDIYGITEGDPQRQKQMIKSLSEIESLKETSKNKGIDDLAESIMDWSTKSTIELQEDDAFNNFASASGIGAEQFQDMVKNNPMDIFNTVGQQLSDAYGTDDISSLHNLRELYGINTDASALQFVTRYRSGLMAQDIQNIQDSANAGENTEGSNASRMANMSVGWVTAFANWFSNTAVVRAASDFFASFDVSTANLANMTIVGRAGLDIFKFIKGKDTGLGKLLGDIHKGGGIKSYSKGLIDDLRGNFLGVKANVKDGLGLGKDFLAKHPTLGNIGSKALSGLGKVGKIGILGALGFGIDAFNGMTDMANTLYKNPTGAQRVAGGVGGILGGTGSGILGLIQGKESFFGLFSDVLANALKGASVGSFGGIAGAIIGGIGGAIGALIGGQNITKLVEPIFSGVENAIKYVWDGISNIFSDAFDWFKNNTAIGNFLFGGTGNSNTTTTIDTNTNVGNTNTLDFDNVPSYDDTDVNSFANGLSRVPYDNMPALLHKDEAVLTKTQANAVRADGGIPLTGDTNEFNQENINLAMQSALGTNGDKDTLKNALGDSMGISNAYTQGSTGILGTIFNKIFTGSSNVSTGGGFFDSIKDWFSDKFGKGSSSSGFSFGGGGGGGASHSFATVGVSGAKGSGIDVSAYHEDIAGDGVNRWAPYVVDALTANGLNPTDDLVNKVLRQIDTESGGNPSVDQQITDVNTENGTPAKGLMQVIDPTFEAYKLQGHDDIYNGYDNLLAAINYAKSRYGDNLDGLGEGHGYKVGTPWIPQDQVAILHKGEAVIPSDVNPFNDALSTLQSLYPNADNVELQGRLQQYINNGNISDLLSNTTNSALANTESDNTLSNSLNADNTVNSNIDTSGNTNTDSGTVSDNSEIVDTLKWQVFRIENKLDALISVVSNGGSQGGTPIPQFNSMLEETYSV